MPKENLDSESEILLRISQGDAWAFRQVFDAYSRQVYSLCLKLTKDAEQAKDLMQEIFAYVWSHPDAYDPKRGSFAAYLFGIARYRAADWWRRNRPQETLKDDRHAARTTVSARSSRTQVSEGG